MGSTYGSYVKNFRLSFYLTECHKENVSGGLSPFFHRRNPDSVTMNPCGIYGERSFAMTGFSSSN